MIVLDVETTGVDYKKNSIVSIGAVDFENPSNQFYAECRIFECAEITDFALSLNGFTRDQVLFTNKYSLKETVRKYFDWSLDIKDKTIAGENPRFNRDFLNESFEKYGLNRIPHRTVDLHSLCYEYHIKSGESIPLKNGFSAISLDTTLNYLGLPSEPNPHNALTGAKMEAEAFSRLLYKTNLFPEYAKYRLPDYLNRK